MLTRKRQLAAKIEAVEGVAETLVAADAKLLVYNPKVSFDVSKNALMSRSRTQLLRQHR